MKNHGMGSNGDCFWSLERDRSEWIGLKGCRVMGKGKNSKTRGTRSDRVGNPVRPPSPLTERIGERDRIQSFFHIGPRKSGFCTEELEDRDRNLVGWLDRPHPRFNRPLQKTSPETLYR
jgi:hypothetical protein